MRLVKRKGNTKAKVDVEHFDEMKKLFHQDIRSAVVMDKVPQNWSLTGIRQVLVMYQYHSGLWRKRAKWIEISRKNDKCQITAVLDAPYLVIFFPCS